MLGQHVLECMWQLEFTIWLSGACQASRIAYGADRKAKGARKGAKKGGQALNKMLKFLLPIAGKQILLLLGLAIVRTALSNRLARIQARASANAERPHITGHCMSCPGACHLAVMP